MKDNSKISVVMTTYNGEKYVVKQLESIFNQSRKPDEVIICDDGSKDATVSLVSAFIEKHQLNNWRLYLNKPNLGWKNNFFKATSLSSGDIIFFSDQDDIWLLDKIEVMSKLMIEHQMGALYGDKIVIDGSDSILKGRQEKRAFTNSLIKISLKPSFYEIKTLGCCMCISKKIANFYKEVNFPDDGHDSQCGKLAVLIDSLWYLDRPVIHYRIHSNNTSGISGVASFGQSNLIARINSIKFSMQWIIRLLEIFIDDKAKISLLNGCYKFQKMRLSYLEGGGSLFQLIFYHRYYRDFSMFCGDFAYKYKLNVVAGKLKWKLRNVF